MKLPARTSSTSWHSAGEALWTDTARGRLLSAAIATIFVPLPRRVRTYYVTQVELAAKVVVDANKPPKSVTVRITHPNSCSLKYDDVDLKLREMLVASGIEPREPTESMELAEAEAAEA